MSKQITLEDNRYVDVGTGMGCWAKSWERGVKIGDVRVIGRILMYATYVYPHRFWVSRISWTPVSGEYNTPENLRNWVNNL